MTVHDEVLRAAQRVCGERGNWTFTAEEVVRALSHLNEHSVRTHVSSRCCVNAPANHPHRWPYFRRLSRGRYEILKAYRAPPEGSAGSSDRVAESAAPYRRPRDRPEGRTIRDTIHAVLQRDGTVYVAECLEVAVVTQGKTLDDALENLEDAIALHLEGEDAQALGLAERPRVTVTYEVPSRRHAAKA